MIEIATGNILEAEAEALVNRLNCVGIMGKGIALQFKQAFPPNYKAYEAACHAGQVIPGKMFTYETGRLTNIRTAWKRLIDQGLLKSQLQTFIGHSI